MNPPQAHECVIAGQLVCSAKTPLKKRGAAFFQITLKRAGGYAVKYTVPAAEAEHIEIGRFYKVAILPDAAPAKPDLPNWQPGDRALLWWTYGSARIWCPATVSDVTPSGRLIVQHWRRVPHESRRVKPETLTPAMEPFPALDDAGAFLPGDKALWRGKQVIIGGFVGTDQAWVNWQRAWAGSSSRIVMLTELRTLAPMLAADP